MIALSIWLLYNVIMYMATILVKLINFFYLFHYN